MKSIYYLEISEKSVHTKTYKKMLLLCLVYGHLTDVRQARNAIIFSVTLWSKIDFSGPHVLFSRCAHGAYTGSDRKECSLEEKLGLFRKDQSF